MAEQRAAGGWWRCQTPAGLRVRRAALALVSLVLILGALALPAGCMNRVIPPAHVSNPVQIFLLDHGRTPSLVLPRGGGGMARYVFGDWNWYARGRTDLCSGLAALLLPTTAGLGLELFDGPIEADTVLDQISVDVAAIYPLVVEREAVERLVEHLEAIFEANSRTMVENQAYQLTFVHHPDRYTYFWNSNHQVAHWLRELGCDVRGPTVNSRWQIQDRILAP
jgi:hypothetical protein